jgi:8-oxo-dGTP pyrophosphatase MutT (NUDIX family)
MSAADLAPHAHAFAPERFRALALQRLARAPDASGFDGDHQLNPDYPRPAGAPKLRDAAVLFPVVARSPEATVVLTRRTDALPSHPGQIALPGGKIDPGDGSAAAAALREAEEEIGLDRSRVEILGYGAPYHSGSGYRIFPVVAMVPPDVTFVPEAGEVADIFEVPLGFLMSAANHRVGSRQAPAGTRYFYEMPWQERHIWGVTAGIVRRIYERLYL